MHYAEAELNGYFAHTAGAVCCAFGTTGRVPSDQSRIQRESPSIVELTLHCSRPPAAVFEFSR